MMLRIVRAVLRPGRSAAWLEGASHLADRQADDLRGLQWLIVGLVEGDPKLGIVTSVWSSRESMEATLPDWHEPGWPPALGELVDSWTLEHAEVTGTWAPTDGPEDTSAGHALS